MLLVHGIRESDIPISNLSAALARMARSLSAAGAPLFAQPDGEPRSELDLKAFRDALASDLAVCIQSLQFHDRLMQQLTQARDILTGLASNKLLAKVPNASANEAGNEGTIELF